MISRVLYKPDWLLHIGHLATLYYNQIYCSQNGGISLVIVDDILKNQELIEQFMNDLKWLDYDSLKIIRISSYYNIILKFVRYLIQNRFAYIDYFEDRYSLSKFDDMIAGNCRNKIKLKLNIPDEPDVVILYPKQIYSVNDLPESMVQKYSSSILMPQLDFIVAFIDCSEKVDHLISTSKVDIISMMVYDRVRSIYKSQIEVKKIYQEPYKITDFKYTKKIIDSLIQEGRLIGYNDPRLLTISGLRRRGYTPDILKSFCQSGMIGKKVHIDYLETSAKSIYDLQCDRCFGVINPIKIIITNWPERVTEFVTKPIIPDNHDIGITMVPLSNIVYIDRADFKTEPDDNFHGLSLDKEVRLKYSYIIKCYDYKLTDSGEISEIYAEYSQQERKIKGCIHWISSLMGREPIKTKFYLYNTVYLGKAFHNNILNIPVKTFDGYIEGNADDPDKVYQLERIGYFKMDPEREQLSYNLVTGLKKQRIPYL
jgi:glutaminyl-tRNA synthetase